MIIKNVNLAKFVTTNQQQAKSSTIENDRYLQADTSHSSPLGRGYGKIPFYFTLILLFFKQLNLNIAFRVYL